MKTTFVDYMSTINECHSAADIALGKQHNLSYDVEAKFIKPKGKEFSTKDFNSFSIHTLNSYAVKKLSTGSFNSLFRKKTLTFQNEENLNHFKQRLSKRF